VRRAPRAIRAPRAAALALVVALASSCAVGPDFVPPEVSPPADYRSHVGAAEAASLADLPWWQVFQDPVLQDLIQSALRQNYDLRSAVARVEQSSQLVRVARSPFYPQIGYEGSAGRQRQPEFQGMPHDTFNLFYGALSLAWEIDVWGRIRRSSEAAQEVLLATESFRRGVMLSLATGVATSYLQLLELDRELQISHETAESFRDTRDLFQRRFEGGVGNSLQVQRAEASLAQTEANIPELERLIVAQENALSVLLGREPGGIPRGTPLEDHPVPPATPPGLPSDLLERRPDVQQAEHTVASANAEVGIAIANFFPRIGLTALYGQQSDDLSDLLKQDFNLWNVAGNAMGPLFQGFALLGQYRAQVAGWDETVAQYQGTVLNAFAEVSDALTAQTKLADARAAQERAVAAYRESVRLARIRYDSGLASYFELLEAQQQLYPAEVSLARIQRDQYLAVIDLYRALGGGWNVTDEQWTQKAHPIAP
jgi:outer membrane protein, multidrug efflux system